LYDIDEFVIFDFALSPDALFLEANFFHYTTRSVITGVMSAFNAVEIHALEAEVNQSP
jgi:hypothetical protein